MSMVSSPNNGQVATSFTVDNDNDTLDSLRAEVERLHQALAMLSANTDGQHQQLSDTCSVLAPSKDNQPFENGSSSSGAVSPTTLPYLPGKQAETRASVGVSNNINVNVISPILSSSSSRESLMRSESNSLSSLDSGAPYTPTSFMDSRRSSSKGDEITVVRERRSLPCIFDFSGSSSPRRPSIFDYTIDVSHVDIATCATSDDRVVEMIVDSYPELCERPPQMFTDDGKPLPPTAQEEASIEEKEARKASILIRDHGSIPHAFLKTSVLLESRTATWKRVGEVSAEEEHIKPAATSSNTIDPWKIKLDHSNLDPSIIARKPLKKNFELYKSRRVGLCQECEGSRTEVCQKCQGSEADECWWCKGSHKSSSCKHCKGSGLLACQDCYGEKTQPCTPCHGKGTGVFVVYLQVRISKVDLDPIPVPCIDRSNQDKVAAIERTCLEKARESVAAFMTSINAPTSRRGSETKPSRIGKSISMLHRPERVLCQLTSSKTHLVQLEVPQAARLVRRKKSTPSLRSNNIFQRKVPLSSSYFLLPSDDEFGPVQVSLYDFEKAVLQRDVAEVRERR